jgi:MacB-like periplasmic core domain
MPRWLTMFRLRLRSLLFRARVERELEDELQYHLERELEQPAQQVAERVAAVPGVVSVGYADLLPLAPGLAPISTFWISGRSERDQLNEDWPVRRVSAGYFRTLQAAVLRGREFTADDFASVRPVMIINETAARRYFRGENPIARSIALGGAGSPLREIVGVVADIKDGPPESPPHSAAYVLFDQSAFASSCVQHNQKTLSSPRLLPQCTTCNRDSRSPDRRP